MTTHPTQKEQSMSSMTALAEVTLTLVKAVSGRQSRDTDQAVLDSIIAAMPREAVREWRQTDLLGGWPKWISECVYALAEMNEVEHRFRDRRMEPLRSSLLAAVVALDVLHSEVAFQSRWHSGGLDFGRSGSEIDGVDDPHTRRMHQNARALTCAAEAMASAYDELLARALKRGYDIRERDLGESKREVQTNG